VHQLGYMHCMRKEITVDSTISSYSVGHDLGGRRGAAVVLRRAAAAQEGGQH
jgi:hypothetical protein